MVFKLNPGDCLKKEGGFMNVTQALVVSTLTLAQKSESLIANNLANYETPGFKASTLSFQGQLSQAMASGAQSVLDVRGTVVKSPGSLRPDGSNVSLTGQMTDLAEVQLTYQMALSAYNHHVTQTKIVTEGKAM
jgi:flagellar basal-body rod protein FlgB